MATPNLLLAARATAVHLCTAVAFVGCVTAYTDPKVEPSDVPFLGIQHGISSGESPDVLLVHGMCTHDEEDLKNATAALGKALKMVPDRSNQVSLHREWGSNDGASLYSSTLTDGTYSVRTYSLLWSPIATAYKRRRLCYDASEPNGSCMASDIHFDKPRALVNKLAKDVLLDDCLADATFYLGSAGGQMLRDAALRAVITALSGGRDPGAGRTAAFAIAASRTAPFFMVTHSLGSKITFDAIQQAPDFELDVALGRTWEIFMEANQLPVLSLGAVSSAKALDGGDAAADPALQSLVNRIVPRKNPRSEASELANTALSIVAFNDPNDLLTWAW